MEVNLFIQRKKELYSYFIDFIESTNDDDFETLIKSFEKLEIFQNKEETISILQLLLKLVDKHHRFPGFITTLEKIFKYIIQQKQIQISDLDLYLIFRKNKFAILFLLEHGLIKLNEKIVSDILQSKNVHYLFSGFKSFIEINKSKELEKEILKKYKEEIELFEEKCRNGENDSYICSLIRKDLVKEFIIYVNQNNISLSSKIKPSIFETNSFLIRRKPTLIEYAAFYGSIQIIQYLKYNKVPLTNSFCIYAVHSNNAELIQFVTEHENEIKPQISYKDIFRESITCHHNDIGDYINDNFLHKTQFNSFSSTIIDSLNYHYFPTNIEQIITRINDGDGFYISQLCSFLTHITIPSSVNSIGNNAFESCHSLKEIFIPSSVSAIGRYAFNDCSSLEQISIPSSVTKIEDFTFYNCTSLNKIIIPSSITSIGKYSFKNCTSLTKISLPLSLTSINDYTFNRCFSLTQISIPSSVTRISNYGFEGCSSLKEIEIPSSVSDIGFNAFDGCSSLLKISIPLLHEIRFNSFCECSSLEQISIPSSVTLIDSYAFYGCTKLEKVSIPSSVISIEQYAFCRCSSLKQISIPSSVYIISKYAFEKYTAITRF